MLVLGPFLLLQRSLHRETQVVFLLLTRRPELAIALFSILLFPGVVLHELSHWLMARLLGVRTGRVSLLPRSMGDGRLQLGFVETAPADPLRDALVGAAPLLVGGAFVAYAGMARLGLAGLWQQVLAGGLEALPVLLPEVYNQSDFWIWFYLAFAISSTMTPSAADRRAWLPVLVGLALLVGLSLLAGAGPWITQNLALPLIRVIQSVTAVFAISLGIHLVLLPPAWGLHRLLARLTGLEVVSPRG